MPVLTDSLVPSLKRAAGDPNGTNHPDYSAGIWRGFVEDAVWTAILKGGISGYTLDVDQITPANDAIVPVAPNVTDLPGELGQLVVEFAALGVITGDLVNMQSTFRAAAGPVTFEVQRSATVLVNVLKSLQEQIGLSLQQIGKYGFVNVVVLDALIERSMSMAFNETWWLR